MKWPWQTLPTIEGKKKLYYNFKQKKNSDNTVLNNLNYCLFIILYYSIYFLFLSLLLLFIRISICKICEPICTQIIYYSILEFPCNQKWLQIQSFPAFYSLENPIAFAVAMFIYITGLLHSYDDWWDKFFLRPKTSFYL